jgi:hypothetical protein
MNNFMSIVAKVGWKNKEAGCDAKQHISRPRENNHMLRLVDCRRKSRKGDPQVAFSAGNAGSVSESYCKSALEITIFWISVVPS